MKNFLSLLVVWLFIPTGVLAQGSPVVQFKTAADLVAHNIPNVSTRLSALLTGVATENDGKGGLFFYQASSAVATNAHSIFKPAGSGGRWLRASLNVSEEDGSPSVLRATGIKVTNGTMTDNGDGTVSITTGAGGGGGSAPVGTVIQDNGATTAFFPPVFESTSGTNLIQALYGYPFNSDPLTPANSTNFNHVGWLVQRRNVNEYRSDFLGLLDFTSVVKTISGGIITHNVAPFTPYLIAAAQAGSSDDLDTVTIPETHDGIAINHLWMFLKADTGDTITVRHGIGNITTVTESDIVLSGDKFALLLSNGTNIVAMSTAGLAPTASPSFTGTATFGTGTGQIDVGTTGVRLSSDGDGAVTILGLGDGSDESLTLNFDDTSNTIVVSSATGVTVIDLGTVGIDLDAGTLRVPNGVTDAVLAVAGDFHINTTDEQISFHSAADGEISGEVSVSALLTKSWSFDPDAVCDGAVDRLFLMWIGDEAPEGIIIDEWKISFEADPTTEIDADLKYADAMIGVANPVTVDALDTTTGTATEDTDANINGGSVIPNGKALYIEFVTPYTESNHQIMFQLTYHLEED